MYSNKEKWELYKNISRELYLLIKKNLDLDPMEIIIELSEHLDKYNEKVPYNLSIKMTSTDGKAVYIMREGKSPLSKELFRKEFHIKNITRNIKIDDLLNDLDDWEDEEE